MNRKYDPIEAAYAVAQFVPADPALWLERAALAGMLVSVNAKGGLRIEYMDADNQQISFLCVWLNLTLGGTEAVVGLLNSRAGG